MTTTAPAINAFRPETQDGDLVFAGRANVAARTVRSQELFGREQEILIEHAGAHYRLRITGKGKLILTK